MKTTLSILAFAAVSLAGAVPALAQTAPADQAQTPPQADVVQRGADGRAADVQTGGQDYAVCSKTVQDHCIQPRAAGLKWGNRPLRTWPGQPASQSDGDQGTAQQ